MSELGGEGEDNDGVRASSATPVALAGERRAVPFRAGGFQPEVKKALALASIVGVLGLWQLASSIGLLNPLFLPSPWTIAQTLWELLVRGDLVRHVGVSLFRVGSGWILGVAAGICVGLAMGIFSLARSLGLPLISALYPIPKIALLPLFILWLGIGEAPKILTIALGVFFPTAISTFAGVDGVARNLIRMGQSFNLSFPDMVRKIVLPGALPSILAGMRISTSTALLLVVSAEMIGAQLGLGSFVLAAGNSMQTENLLAGVVTLSALGLTLATLLSRLEKRLLRWR
jgi:ABC-type nitrate/sulfonate/bicarbonate transport system permease component